MNGNILRYVRKNILDLAPYSTARDDFQGSGIDVWADANENPYDNGLNRYPDPRHNQLKQAVSRLKDVPSDRIFIGGAGSDEAIDLCYRIFCDPGVHNAVAIAPTYGVYRVAADINNVQYREVPLNPDFSLPVDRILQSVDRDTRLIWICSPNNPTSNAFDPEEILDIARHFDGMVVVDEAYGDFSPYPSMTGELDRHPNIIVLQTFSKAWGLASLRVGMAFAHPEIAAVFGKVKYPYNLNGPTQMKLLDLIDGGAPEGLGEILQQREMLAQALRQSPQVVTVFPSHANFLLVRFKDAARMYRYLLENGVLVRNRSSQRLCQSTLRITIGTPGENLRMAQLINSYPDEQN